MQASEVHKWLAVSASTVGEPGISPKIFYSHQALVPRGKLRSDLVHEASIMLKINHQHEALADEHWQQGPLSRPQHPDPHPAVLSPTDE